jgi:hypothetical protein
MPTHKECPLCGGTMQLKQIQDFVQLPGNPKPTKRAAYEWLCPDCDHFEEAREDEV